MITSVDGVSPEVNKASVPLDGLHKWLNRCNSMCMHHSTRLKGFHKPPAPLLVVSSPSSSAMICTWICGTAFCSLIPVASPLTPPPMIATFSGIFGDSVLVALLSRRGQLKCQCPSCCILGRERVHYTASLTAPADYIFSQSTKVFSKHHV